jgi:hypothetical protein
MGDLLLSIVMDALFYGSVGVLYVAADHYRREVSRG